MGKAQSQLLASILLICAAGCQAQVKEQGFSHRQRLDYAISDVEFEKIKFYTSEQVIVRAVDEIPEFDTSGSGVIIAPRGTDGKVVAVGPDWLRVTFGLGEGAYFKTDTSKAYDSYWLATEVEGKDGLFILKNQSEKFLLVGGIRYEIIRGSTAALRIDVDSWKRFVSTRTHVPGKESTEKPQSRSAWD